MPDGEQRLMLAMRRTDQCLSAGGNVAQYPQTDAVCRCRALIMASPNAQQQAFSFESWCDALEINPSVLRRRMVLWKHKMSRDAVACHAAFGLRVTPRTST